jgi:hypothetical protein
MTFHLFVVCYLFVFCLTTELKCQFFDKFALLLVRPEGPFRSEAITNSDGPICAHRKDERHAAEFERDSGPPDAQAAEFRIPTSDHGRAGGEFDSDQ